MAVAVRRAADRAAGPLLLCALFAGLVAWSFRKWADVQIDFGNELYVAWRLSEGEVLYRDLAQRNGPLSHYLNALWFRAFGVSLTTLAVANLAILAGIAAMLWRLFARTCDRTTATLCAAVLLCVFAFGQYGVIGNFNYVTPYHHFQTHGIALCLALLLGLDAAARRATSVRALAAGVCLGALFLTKIELFVPGVAMAAVTLLASAHHPGAAARGPGWLAARLVVGASLPVALFLGIFAREMPLDRALVGVAGNWAHLGGLANDPFYRRGAGLDAPLANLAAIARASAAIAALATGIVALDRVAAGRLRSAAPRVVLGGIAFGLLVFAGLPWWHAAAALPALALLGVAVFARGMLRAEDPGERRRRHPLLLFSVLSAGLLGKIALAARIDWYGFVLAMPATLLGVAGLVHGLPAWLARRHGGGELARVLGIAVVGAATVSLLSVSDRAYAQKDFPIGRGGDRILARGPETSPRAAVLSRTLALLDARLRPGDTLLVLPEGAMLNYWLRVPSGSRYLLFLPTEIQAFGEDRMLAELRSDPPDYVVLVHRLWDEFGVGPFGTDPRNGAALRAWVDRRYRRIQRFGAEPFGADGFGTVVLERADRAAARPR